MVSPLQLPSNRPHTSYYLSTCFLSRDKHNLLSFFYFRFPDLQINKTHVYSQEDVKGIIAYAKDRGIRVIPEVESGYVGAYNCR